MNDDHESRSRTVGAFCALGGFLMWGCFPLFWKSLHEIPALEAIMHRVVWSCVFLLPVVAWQNRLTELVTTFRSPRVLGLSVAKSLLLSANWLIYIWAVNRGMVVESSLGYFLVPLVNVAFGRLFQGERFTVMQRIAILFAMAGVGLLLFQVGHVPWVALGLAGTWSIYGLLKKRSALGPIVGLTVETLVLFLPCAAMLGYWAIEGKGGLGHTSALTQVLILSTGVVTAVPLVLFAKGAQSIRMTTLGLLQYITPTVQFLIGIFVYQEPFDAARLRAFVLIWIGLAIYSVDAVLAERARRASQTAAPEPA
ncbi:MAG: EamA family transporter RarD [Opitutaceae bacterium]|nr:EamA family transporter RarD [Opitutaceae bacterium]